MFKGINDISGNREIKGMRSLYKRAMPRPASSRHLELYMLEKEKERSEKEASVLDRRRVAIQKRLRDIEDAITNLEGSSARQERAGGTGIKKDSPAKSLRLMRVNY
jgi:hypothetical protein